MATDWTPVIRELEIIRADLDETRRSQRRCLAILERINRRCERMRRRQEAWARERANRSRP